MASQIARGVALIVQNPEGNILILQEYETKAYVGKYRGMFSIPMETSEPDESDYETLVRLAQEELPGLDILIDHEPLPHIGAYQIIPNVWGNLYFVKTANAQLPDINSAGNNEVGNHLWAEPKKALELWLRQGAREMISDFSNNKKGVVCRECQTP